ncbi:D-2-hydroxyacid dehydrogenase [Natrinema sp. SYSU A 869]|uniref:D-2-hydroxyacid dehydrogenase n=1 Tax=Natrinema sp. SYSU A 869 TaxID=2871694 RepID=UPI001CA3F7DD|nr:D-2-hydroxyacid dehydrogenase [Natrinema sp. SYSU A 869]
MSPIDVLILSGMPSETPETTADLVEPIVDRHPDIDVTVAGNYSDGVDKIRTANAVIALHPTSDHLDNAERLEWMHTLSAGVDHFPLDRLQREDVVVTTASSANSNAVAEHTLSLMLAFERNLNHAIRNQERTEWQLQFSGELNGQTVGILGLGQIGRRVAELCTAFGMDVVGLKRDLSDVPDSVDEIYLPDELHTVLGKSDYVVIACPLTDETKGMISIKELSESMKRSAVLINVARGEIVEEQHVSVAVQRGYIAGAALDVFEEEPLPPDSPIWNTKDIIVTPHAGGTTDRFLQGCGVLFAKNYDHYSAGRLDEMRNRVI